MLIPMHHTAHGVALQPASFVGDTWATAVVPRLPAALATHACVCNAFQRVRGVATPADLLRAVLAYGLGTLSTRRLGAWAVLIGLADIAQTAWCKRFRASNAWLLWLLGALLAAPGPLPRSDKPGSRPVRLSDATRLRHPGATGDDWRVHFASNCTVGRLDEGVVPDQHTAERLAYFTLQPGCYRGRGHWVSRPGGVWPLRSAWSLARIRLCLPRLRRFLCRRPRRREHQETAVRAWLATWQPAWEFREDHAARAVWPLHRP